MTTYLRQDCKRVVMYLAQCMQKRQVCVILCHARSVGTYMHRDVQYYIHNSYYEYYSQSYEQRLIMYLYVQISAKLRCPLGVTCPTLVLISTSSIDESGVWACPEQGPPPSPTLSPFIHPTSGTWGGNTPHQDTKKEGTLAKEPISGVASGWRN